MKALVKKSGVPKLPDFSVMCKPWGAAGEAAWHHGTPGGYRPPMRICSISRRLHEAPEGLTAGHDQLAHAQFHQAAGNAGNGLLDHGAGLLHA